MDSRSIFTKTAKGLGEASGKTSDLPRDLRNILKEVDGKASIGALAQKIGGMTEPKLMEAFARLAKEGYARELAVAPQSAAPPRQSASSSGEDDLDFTSVPATKPAAAADDAAKQKAEAAARARAEAVVKARLEAESRAKAEAEAKAKAEAEAKAKADAAAKAKAEAEARAIAEAAAKAKAEAAAKARAEAEAKAKADAAAKAKAEAEAKAKAEAEAKAKEEAAAKAKAEAEARAKVEAEARAKAEAEARARRQAEEKAREEAERARKEAEEKTRQEAERARREAEEKTRQEAERARREAEELRARLERERREREEAERKLKEETERLAREAEERSRREAEERARREQEDKARREAEEKSRRAAEEARREAEELRARLEQERSAREDSERRAREEAERLAREAAEKARREAEEKAEREAGEKAEREAEEKARREAGEKAEREAREIARREAEEKARRDAEDRARREEEDRRRREEEDLERRAEQERRRLEKEELDRREEQERRTREEDSRRKAELEAIAAKQAEEQAAQERREAEEKRERAKAEEEARAEADRQARAREKDEAEKRRRSEAAASELKAQGPYVPAHEIHAKRRRSFAKPIAVGLFVMVIAAVVSIQFVALDSASFESAAASRFGQPVKIGSVNISLFPVPGLRLGGIAIGEAAPVKIAVAHVAPEFASIFESRKIFKSVEIEGMVLPPAAIGAILFAKSKGDTLRVDRVIAKSLKLDFPGLSMPPLDVDARIGAGGLEKLTFANADKKLTGSLQAGDDKFQFELVAKPLQLPIEPAIELDDFSGKGVISAQDLTLNEFQARLFEGSLEGNAKLRWDRNWSFEGDLVARQMDAAKIAAPLLRSGQLEGKGSYAMRAPAADKLFASVRLDAIVTVQKGSIGSIDLPRVLQGADPTGGSTLFSELSGSIVAERARLQIRQLRLAAGLMSGNGALDVDAQKNISGRLQVELRAQATQARAAVAVSGTLGNPQFRRTN